MLMVKSRPRDGTEPAVFIYEVAKQHDVFAGATAFGLLVSARTSLPLCFMEVMNGQCSGIQKIFLQIRLQIWRKQRR